MSNRIMENIRYINLISHEDQPSLDRVIDYLYFLTPNATIVVKRHNTEEIITNSSIRISNNFNINSVTLEGKNGVNQYFKKATQSSWYRRGHILLDQFWVDGVNSEKLNRYLKQETEFLHEYMNEFITGIGGYYEEIRNNKLINLSVAVDSGMKVPETLVTTSKKEVEEFIKRNKKTITKPLHNAHIRFTKENKTFYSPGTILVDNIDEMPDNFGPSLFQEYIEKDVEIRVFALDNELYAMAIFSQLDEKTMIDFRNYNNSRPNRCIPFSLPDEVELKLLNILDKLSYRTCSIDLIMTKDREFYFLEINPSGQYGWLSKHCNYNLEEKIAKKILS